MRKSIFSLFVVAMAMVFMSNDAKAQVPDGEFGIGASIGAGAGAGQLYYALANNMDLALTLGVTNTDNNGVTNTGTTAGLQYRYLWTANTIDPYFSIGANYIDGVGVIDGIGVTAAFGAQAQLVKNVFLTTQLGLTYSAFDNDVSQISFGGSGLGAIIYFDAN